MHMKYNFLSLVSQLESTTDECAYIHLTRCVKNYEKKCNFSMRHFMGKSGANWD